MPDIAALGPESLLIYGIRMLFANSATFRTWTGTSTEADALARTHEIELDTPELGDYPFVIVSPGDEHEDVKIAEGNAYDQNGSVDVVICAHATEEREIDAFRDFCNKTGAIKQEILALSNSDHPTDNAYRFINIKRLARVGAPGRTVDMENQITIDEYMVRWIIEWGAF